MECNIVSFPLVDWRGISPFIHPLEKQKKEDKKDILVFEQNINTLFEASCLRQFKIGLAIKCYLDTYLELDRFGFGSIEILSLGKRNDIVFLYFCNLQEYKKLITGILTGKVESSDDIILLANLIFDILNTCYPKYFSEFRKVEGSNGQFQLRKN